MGISELKYCECGCNQIVKPKNKYILGHNRRLQQTKGQTYCYCGCGGLASPNNEFINGHNILITLKKKFGPDWIPPVPQVSKPCKCNCGNFAKPGCEYINGHNRKNTEIKPESVKKGIETKRRNGTYEKQIPRLRKNFIEHNPMKDPAIAKVSADKKRAWAKTPDGISKIKKAVSASTKSILLNSKYYWEGVPFLSKQEMECAKKILTFPEFGINCHIHIKERTIDFFPQISDKMFIGCFVEYHPCPCFWDERTPNEYLNDRLRIIENSEYSDIPLVLITSMKELNKEVDEKCLL